MAMSISITGASSEIGRNIALELSNSTTSLALLPSEQGPDHGPSRVSRSTELREPCYEL